tara:strand:+ start:511 stop:813 length:303 start_codon:yes stop_codon:yes gene_type:complete
MKVCVSCSKNKEDKDFPSYLQKCRGRDGAFKKKNKCKKCQIRSGDGVAPDIYGNNISLKNKAFMTKPTIDSFTMKSFSDCAIDEMGLSYDDFDDIPGLDD